MTRVRVVFLTSSMQVGGQEQYISQQVQHLDRKQFEPILCCLKDQGPMAESVRVAGIPVFSGFQRFKYDAGALVRLTRFLVRQRPSVVYVFDFRNVLFIGRLAAKLARAPVCVIASHKMNWKGSGRSYTSWLDRLLMPLADHVIAAADAHRMTLVQRDGLPAAKVTTIHNGIDLTRLARDAAAPVARKVLGVPDGCPVIGVVARLVPEKSHETILTAMPRILDSAPTTHVVFVGDGPYRAILEDRARASGLAARVHFLGVQHRVAPLLGISTLGIDVTYGRALLRGDAGGDGVRAPGGGDGHRGMREMVVDDVTGVLVPPNNPSAFAEAIVRLLTRPDERSRMGQAGAERVRAHFTAEREARELGDLLLRLVAATGSDEISQKTGHESATDDGTPGHESATDDGTTDRSMA